MTSRPAPEGDAGRDPRYRVTRWSIPWLVAFVLLVPYELAMIAAGHDGGPLTHVVKAAYGEPLSVRWWLVGWATSGFLLWTIPHFLFEGWGLPRLLALIGAGLVIGIVGALLTR